MNPIRLVVALALVATAPLLAVPADAVAATGCAARPDLEHRVLVKKKRVVTRDGERFGALRFYGGVVFGAPLDGGPGSFDPAWCLDLVVADAFAGRTPRDRGRVAYDGARVPFAGRASTRVLSAGGGSSLEGQHVEITYVVDGRKIKARRVMRLVFPEVG